MDGGQRVRAGSLHADGRPAQAEPVRDPGGLEVEQRAAPDVAVRNGGVPAVAELVEVKQHRVGGEAGAGEHAGERAVIGGRVAGGLQRVPADLQEHALERIGDLGLGGCDVEEGGGELLDAGQPYAGADVVR